MRKFALGLSAAVFLTTIASAQHKIGEVFQARSPDGQAYLVVSCLQQDDCLEQAYKFCNGPYQPLEPGFVRTSGFRFVCRDAQKKTTGDTSEQPAPHN